jgi:cobalamin-dependent methionine synthase I
MKNTEYLSEFEAGNCQLHNIVKFFSTIKKAFEYISKHIDKEYSAITIGFWLTKS